MRRHASDLAWRPILQAGNMDEIVVVMEDSPRWGRQLSHPPGRRSASAYFHPTSLSGMSREGTLKSLQGSLGVHLGHAVVEPEDSDCGSTEDSGFTSVRENFVRQSTSNSLQIPGDGNAPKAVADPEVPFTTIGSPPLRTRRRSWRRCPAMTPVTGRRPPLGTRPGTTP
jgi:hypothetical protein